MVKRKETEKPVKERFRKQKKIRKQVNLTQETFQSITNMKEVEKWNGI
jgi:hypothetical protein